MSITEKSAGRPAAAKEATRDIQAKPYDKDKVSHIVKLYSMLSKAQGFLQGAQTELTTLKGHEISPDGKLGGKGYVKTLREFKEGLSSMLTEVSDLTDTLSDEMTNPQWELSREQIEAFQDDVVAKVTNLVDGDDTDLASEIAVLEEEVSTEDTLGITDDLEDSTELSEELVGDSEEQEELPLDTSDSGDLQEKIVELEKEASPEESSVEDELASETKRTQLIQSAIMSKIASRKRSF